jgi:hypothetical protein
MQEKPGKLIPALVGGAFIAFFSRTPLLNLGNCLCCLWVVLGGFLAAWMYRRSLSPAGDLTSADGALSGFLAGAFGALFGGFLQYFFAMIGLDFSSHILDEMLNSVQDMPEELAESMEMIRSMGAFNPVLVLLGLVSSFIVNSIFATAGGLIAASVLKKGSTPSGRRKR